MGIIDDVIHGSSPARYDRLYGALIDDFRRTMTTNPAAEASLKLDLMVVHEFLFDIQLRMNVGAGEHVEKRLHAFEDLIGDQLTWTKSGNLIRTGPLFVYAASEMLDQLEAQFRGGDQRAVLFATATCGRHGLLTPQWAADPFCHGVDRVRRFEVPSWDLAFGRPMPKGRGLKAIRREAQADRIVLYVARARNEGRAVDKLLFDDIAEEFSIYRSKVEEIYYRRRKQLIGDFAARVVP